MRWPPADLDQSLGFPQKAPPQAPTLEFRMDRDPVQVEAGRGAGDGTKTGIAGQKALMVGHDEIVAARRAFVQALLDQFAGDPCLLF